MEADAVTGTCTVLVVVGGEFSHTRLLGISLLNEDVAICDIYSIDDT